MFLFGSELKALRAKSGWAPKVRPDAVAAYMRHGYIPGPHTIYEGVQKLEPGTVLTFRARENAEPEREIGGVVQDPVLERYPLILVKVLMLRRGVRVEECRLVRQPRLGHRPP